jgi:ATP-binding cassette subfamily B protein
MATKETPSPFAVKKIKWEGLKITIQLLRYLRPYRFTFAAGMLFLVLSTGTSLAFSQAGG